MTCGDLGPVYPEMTLRCRDCGNYWHMLYEYDEGPFGDLVPVPVEEGGDECPNCGMFGNRVDSPWAGGTGAEDAERNWK